MKRREMLERMREDGALIIQAHPFREAHYIECVRLFPNHVDGVEVFNACNTESTNEMAKKYADHYGLRHFAGSDNHSAGDRTVFGGMRSNTPIVDEKDFISRVRNGEMTPFVRRVEE